MRRGAWAAVVLAVAVAVAIGGVVALSGDEPARSAAAQDPPAATAAVERGRLAAMVSQGGTLAYRARTDGSPYMVVNQAGGVYTRLPEDGDRVACGDVLYRVDDRPVLLLCGAVPAYRDLGIGDRGDDVRQLNRGLRRFGADADDHDFTGRTARALRKLQHREGAEETGVLAFGDAVFLPRPVRIAAVTGRLGALARPGAPVAQATSDTLEVRMDLDPSQRDDVRVGDRARVTLPDHTTATGRVDRRGDVVLASSGGQDDGAATPTIPVYVRLDHPGKARGLDAAPVQVEITTRGVADALSVPVTALLGRSGGGFAVEVVRAGRRRALVGVELGLFDTAGGRVQVEGALREGDRVVVPSS